jgi:hypothetical protein
MSIFWKTAVFIEKLTVTSSNCYETMKNTSILIKLGTNVDWTIAFVTTCSVLNFLLPWQRGDTSKLSKINILPWFFPSNFISKCCNFSRDSDRVKGFSVLVTRYRRIDLGSFLAFHKSKIFLAIRGTATPFKSPKQTGAHPPSGNPLMYLVDGGRAEKVLTFFNNISQTKTWVWGPNRTFFHYLRPKRERGVKSALFCVYMGQRVKEISYVKQSNLFHMHLSTNVLIVKTYNFTWYLTVKCVQASNLHLGLEF